VFWVTVVVVSVFCFLDTWRELWLLNGSFNFFFPLEATTESVFVFLKWNKLIKINIYVKQTKKSSLILANQHVCWITFHKALSLDPNSF
jgi:hypothetical protein